MKNILVFAFAICTSAWFLLVLPSQAQNGTDAEISFVEQSEEAGRDQLRSLLSRYDLDSWIFTREVRIKAGVEPRSMPVLTLNTDFLDDDEMQLSVFLHEQAHWFVDRAEGRDAAVKELTREYTNPPDSSFRTYQHLLVAWVELDAMAELIGEEKARQLLRAKVERLTREVSPRVASIYRWYNVRVLEDTDKIGAVLAKHGLTITPEKGLVVNGK